MKLLALDLLLIGPLLVFLFVFGRMAWRILHHNEEMESGGSYGRQMRRDK